MRVEDQHYQSTEQRGHAVKKISQRLLYCKCGREKIIAHGLCATCYTLKRQDEKYFGGLRERVLARDHHRCRSCGASGRKKRSIAVHHRLPGTSTLESMIALCPACHAKISRTRVLVSEMTPLLLELWREQHPHAHEQRFLDFGPQGGRVVSE